MDDKMSDVGAPNDTPYDPDQNMAEVDQAPALSIVDDADEVADKELPPTEEEVIETGIHHWEIDNWKDLPDRTQGPVFEAGGHKWNILLFPRGNNNPHTLSIYLEFADLRDNPPPDTYACAYFAICISQPSDPTQYISQFAQHRFSAEESDWGFAKFMELHRLYQADPHTGEGPYLEADKLRITVFVRVVKDPTGVLWHNFINYDSKKTTGYVGLKNQGATCYMNSLFQSLYCTNYFRKAVYQIPTENDDPNNSIPFALQRLFYNLQYNDNPVGTTELTRSFGWKSVDAFMQHDVQEFNRVLQDALEVKMKDTPADGAIKKLFLGKMRSYIKCINVNYESSRSEDYYDIQLNVKGCKNLEESFKNYVAEETLEGENKYMAEGYGLQDAKKGVIFESFPPVLHLQLKRFEYDIMKDSMVKINDRHEFPLEIDLEPYLSPNADRSQPHKYALHGVLVHSGDVSGGHYFAFVKPTKDGKWLKFDDDRVIPAALKEVLEENYGGEPLNSFGMNARPNVRMYKRFTNAYMLVYIRESMLDEILTPVTDQDIPQHLIKRMEDERLAYERRKKEHEEMHLYMKVYIVTDKTFQSNEGFDFIDLNTRHKNGDSAVIDLRERKDMVYGAFMENLANTLGLELGHFRLWLLVNRQNRTVRPDAPIPESEEEYKLTLEEIAQKYATDSQQLRLYVETAQAFENGVPVFPPAPANGTRQTLVFIKLFEPEKQRIRGIGRLYVPKLGKVGSIIDALNEMAGFPAGTELLLFEEIKPTMIDQMDLNVTFTEAEIQDGDIICIQRWISKEDAQKMEEQDIYPFVPTYLDFLLKKVNVLFSPKDRNPEKEIELVLHKGLKYDDVALRLGNKIGTDPAKIQFFVAGINDEPKNAIRRLPNLPLEEMLHGPYNRTATLHCKLFYEVLDISLAELELKRLVKINVCAPTLKDCNPVEVWMPKTGRIGDLLREVKFEASANGTRRIRVYEAINHRFHREFLSTDSLSQLSDSPSAQLYAEVIPEEEQLMADGDIFVGVFHYQRDISRTHGVPFKFLVKKDEPFSETKKRLQARTGIPDKEWSKVKFNIVSSYSAAPIDDDDYKLSDHQFGQEDSLGLDHIDRTGRVNRIGLEKPLSIRG